MELGQTVVALCSGEAIQETSPLASDSVHCAMLLSRSVVRERGSTDHGVNNPLSFFLRTMEMLSHQKSLYKVGL